MMHIPKKNCTKSLCLECGLIIKIFLVRCFVSINFVQYISVKDSTNAGAESNCTYVMTYDYVVSEYFQPFVSVLV